MRNFKSLIMFAICVLIGLTIIFAILNITGCAPPPDSRHYMPSSAKNITKLPGNDDGEWITFELVIDGKTHKFLRYDGGINGRNASVLTEIHEK